MRVAASSFLAILVILVAVDCGGGEKLPGQPVATGNGSFRRVSPSELQTLLRTKDFPLVNVHIPYEGEIARTDAFIPFDVIAQQTDRLPRDKAARVILYCRTGRMSTEAAASLVSLGYTNVVELGGGMLEWEKAGLALEQRSR